MKKDKILIYGASGYMGQLFIKTVSNKGFEIVLGARNTFDSKYPIRLFTLNNQASIIDNIKDIKLVINLAGPFKNTNKQLIETCLTNGTHYVDIAGEESDFRSIYEYDEKAKKANIMLMPGAGFGVVPTDIVANLAKQKLPDATHLKIAYITNGGASRGTLKTVLADINKEGIILEDGIFKKALPAFKTFQFIFGGKEQKTVYNPWRADLFTAMISTGIQNVETYANFPNFIVKMMQGEMLWLRDFILKRLLFFLPLGPSEKQIQKGNTICYAEVSNSKGEIASASILGPEAYLFTAETLLAITKNVMNENFKAGFQTPNIYGVDLIKSIQGTKII